MAVSIAQAPEDISPIGNGVIWKLLLDDFGVDPLRNKIAYQLFTGADEITPLRTVKPPGDGTPEEFIVNATKALKEYNLVKTTIPSLGLGTPGIVENDTTIIKSIILKYGDAIYNSSDCETEIDTDSTSDEVKVINAAVNLYDAKVFNNSNQFFLNSMPTRMNIFYDTRVWLWLMNGSNIGIEHTAFYKDGTTQTVNGTATIGWQVPIFAISNAALSDYFPIAGLYKIESVLTFGTPAPSEHKITTCYMPCERPSMVQEFYALDPLGGYNTFLAERVETDVDSDQSTVDLPLNADDPDYTASGMTILEKDTRIEQTYIRKLPNDEEHAKYVMAIQAATKYLVRIKDEDGESKLCNFNISGGVRVFNTDAILEVQIKGTIGVPILTQL